MSSRTINSPGVEIFERDLSLVAPKNVGTNVFVTGYANQGPTDEVIQITTDSEFQQIFGEPTNSAERYFYNSVIEVVNSPANVLVSRLPYGEDMGVGFGNDYSILAYPVKCFGGKGGIDSNKVATKELTSLTAGEASPETPVTYLLGSPIHMKITEDQYQKLKDGSALDWSSGTSTETSIKTFNDIHKAGVVVLNKAKTTINDQFEGYYCAIADNLGTKVGSIDYTSVIDVKTLHSDEVVTKKSNMVTIPTQTLQFSLSAKSTNPRGSVSELIESIPEYDINTPDSDNLLTVAFAKLRKSAFATEAFKLDIVVEDGILGSINYFTKKLAPNGGAPVPYFIETQDTQSRNIEIFVNDHISNRNGMSPDQNGGVGKKIRVFTNQLENYASTPTLSARAGIATAVLPLTATTFNKADSLVSGGVFGDTSITSRTIGETPRKIRRALDAIRNLDEYDIDIVIESGLGTVYAARKISEVDYYNESDLNDKLKSALDEIRTSNEVSSTLLETYNTVFNEFENFCSPPYIGGGRGDCMFISDPLRHIFVTGKDSKIIDNKANNFSQHILWPIKHQFKYQNTSYAATYGNWQKMYDPFSGENLWMPFSGTIAKIISSSTAKEFAWSAPAGLNRGIVMNAIDIAVNPNQGQRDSLYKASINPICSFAKDGIVVFGQKTLQAKPSSFDRINVRRLFLALERPIRKLARYFVFEPNTTFTQTRFKNAVIPTLEYAKNNQGVYDYMVVCDERNNTPEVIDNNELVMDIYIKAVRTAEFIRINFISTRTDAKFEEIVNG